MPESMESFAAIFSLSATIWLTLGLGLAQLLRRQPARAHGVLVASLVGTLLNPVFYFGIQQANWGMLPASKGAPVMLEPIREVQPTAVIEKVSNSTRRMEVPERGQVSEGSEAWDPALPTARHPETTERTEALGAAPDAVDVAAPSGPVASSFSWKGLLLWGWFGASVSLLVRLGLDFVAGCRLARKSRPLSDISTVRDLASLAQKLGLKSAPLLAVSDSIASPVLWAWSWPARILLPADRGASPSFQGVYLHELAHLARRDHLSAFLGEFVWCLIPWHPLAWWARRSLEARAEEACDDWAIACGCQAADYAEELVHLAPSRAGALTMAAVSQSSRLKMRVSRLLYGAFSSPRLGRRWMWGVGLSALLFTGLMSILQPHIVQAKVEGNEPNPSNPESSGESQVPSPGPDTTEVSVMVDGKPLTGAKVWMSSPSTDLKKGVSWAGPFISDAKGQASFAIAPDQALMAVARDNAGRIGLTWLNSRSGRKVSPVLHLEATTEIEAAVTFQGKPMSGVKGKPLVLFQAGKLGSGAFLYPEILPGAQIQSSEQGVIRFTHVPKGFGIGCEIADKRFAWGITELFAGSKNRIDLLEPGTLQLQFDGTTEPPSPDTYHWHLKPTNLAKRLTSYTQNFQLGSRGHNEHFGPLKAGEITHIAPGEYEFSVESGVNCPFFFSAIKTIDIKPGNKATIKVPVKKRVLVQGKIIDAITGQGIPSYSLWLFSDHGFSENLAKGNGAVKKLQEWAGVKTDAKGFYEVYVRGDGRYGFTYARGDGKTDISQYQLSSYDFPSRTYGVRADVPKSGKFMFPDLRLTPNTKLAGKIVDKQGQPWNQPVQFFCPVWQTDALDSMAEGKVDPGSFALTSLAPNLPVVIRVQSGKAVNVPVAVTPAEVKDKGLSIVLGEENGVTFTGTIQDQSGKPVPKVRLNLYWYFKAEEPGLMRYQKKIVESGVTDEQGKFKLTGHWPKERYHLAIEKEGYFWKGFPTPARDKNHSADDMDYDRSLVESPSRGLLHLGDLKLGQPGETVDYGTIRLTKTDNIVRGKVIGLDGRPVSGIQIVAAADGLGPLETKTDANGQFKINQLLDGYGFLIAKGPGYRATYAPFQSDQDDLSITIRRSSEPALPGPVISKTFLASREKMVRHVLESIWKTREVNGWGGRMLEAMADLDPLRAREWVDACAEPEKTTRAATLRKKQEDGPLGTGKEDEVVRLALGNVEDGIALAKGLKPAGPHPLLRIGEKLLEQNKAASLRFAEEATVLCRAMGPNESRWKIYGLSKAGEIVWLAGNKEGGRKLIQEAIELLNLDPKSPSFGASCASIAQQLAVIDWPEAKRLLDRCENPRDFNPGLASSILKIARRDFAAARAKLPLFRDLNGDVIGSDPNACRLDLARQIVAKEPKEALSLVEELRSMKAFNENYAQGLVEIALSIHAKDPEGAYRLVDQAFDFLDELDHSQRSGDGKYKPVASSAVMGAQIVYKVQKIGYPDPHALIARTLSYLGGDPDRMLDHHKNHWREAAFALAFTDPKLAKKVLERHSTLDELAAGWSGKDGEVQRFHRRREIGFMLALIDPEKTIHAYDAMAAKGWTTRTISEASLSEIFGSFAKPGDLMENIQEWERTGWFR